MTRLHLQLLASKWELTLKRHQDELDEMRREIIKAFPPPPENDCGNDVVSVPLSQWARRT